MKYLIAVVLLAFTSFASAEIIMSLEQPVNGATVSGVQNIRGWAVTTQGVIKSIKVYIDEEYKFNVPIGGQRKDVSRAYPTASNSASPGYSTVQNWNNLEDGKHTIRVVVKNNKGDVESDTHTFWTTSFISPYIRDPDMDISGAKLTLLGPLSFIMSGVNADGFESHVLMEWRTAAQNFVIGGVMPVEPDPKISNTSINDGMFNVINGERKINGDICYGYGFSPQPVPTPEAPLEGNFALNVLALLHSIDMAVYDYDGPIIIPLDNDFGGDVVGEATWVVTDPSVSDQDLMDAVWFETSTCQVLMNPDATHMGVGVVTQDNPYKRYITVLIGTK